MGVGRVPGYIGVRVSSGATAERWKRRGKNDRRFFKDLMIPVPSGVMCVVIAYYGFYVKHAHTQLAKIMMV